MFSKKVSLVILFIVCSLMMVACGASPSPPGPPPSESPSGGPPGDEPDQVAQPSVEQPAAGEQAANPPAEAPSNQTEPENPPDLAVAAQTLGITEQELMDALGPPPPDLAAAAQTLGITEPELQQALFPAGGPAQTQVTMQSEDAGVTEPTAAPVVEQSSAAGEQPQATAGGYPIVDTGQTACYDNQNSIDCPQAGAAFFGQDAQYADAQPSYTDNGNGTTTDNVTGLMWQQSPDINGDGAITAADKLTYTQAGSYCQNLSLAGYDDWRLPDIKQLYSLIDFNGTDASGYEGADTTNLVPFLNTNYFDFAYGDTNAGERIIDSQYASSTLYGGSTANDGGSTMFGVNLADGRIKGYGLKIRGRDKTFFVICVRGNTSYGQNDFVDNGDGTITDNATGLIWQQADSSTSMNWADSLAYCQDLSTANYDDWRLPNVKELQSIIDYNRSPQATGSAAIDPLFTATPITNEAGQPDYAAYWASTTHPKWTYIGDQGVYLTFGRAMGYLDNVWQDVHGAGAQRSDPKTGNPADYPTGHGPQGDAIRIYNYARCVRGGAEFVEGAGTGADITVQQPAGGQPAGDGPPQEAIDACSGLSENASCQVTTPRGDISGTCTSIAGQLACIPAGGPPSQ